MDDWLRIQSSNTKYCGISPDYCLANLTTCHNDVSGSAELNRTLGPRVNRVTAEAKDSGTVCRSLQGWRRQIEPHQHAASLIDSRTCAWQPSHQVHKLGRRGLGTLRHLLAQRAQRARILYCTNCTTASVGLLKGPGNCARKGLPR